MSKRPDNIGLVFEKYAASSPTEYYIDRPFDIAPEGGTTYDVPGLADLVARTSASLYDAGLRKGDRMAIIKDNHFDVVLLAAAAARIGAVGAMISNLITSEHLRTMMERLDPTILVASPGVLEAAGQAGVSLVGPGVITLVAGGDQTFVREHHPIPAADPCGDDDPMICTHTSGTTGVPKIVVYSPNTILGTLARLERLPIPRLSIKKSDVVGSCISYIHGRAITWTAAQLARPPKKIVIMSGSEPDNVAAHLSRHELTTMEACPNLFQRWEGLTITHPHLFKKVRTFFNTFDAVHPRTVRTFLEASGHRSPLWIQVWGQSEVGPVCPGIYTRKKVRKMIGANTAVTSDFGAPLPVVTKIKVVDPETRKKVGRGKEGIILVKTKGQCIDYMGERERYDEKLWDGWWNSGDIGIQRRGGGIRILDREVDIIPGISGIELEGLLLERFENATEIVVLAVPGRQPVPVVSTADGDLDRTAWQQATAGFPPLDEPILIDWEDYPRTATYKVQRFQLREQLLGSAKTYGTGRWT